MERIIIILHARVRRRCSQSMQCGVSRQTYGDADHDRKASRRKETNYIHGDDGGEEGYRAPPIITAAIDSVARTH
jgi:hypothetical protein